MTIFRGFLIRSIYPTSTDSYLYLSSPQRVTARSLRSLLFRRIACAGLSRYRLSDSRTKLWLPRAASCPTSQAGGATPSPSLTQSRSLPIPHPAIQMRHSLDIALPASQSSWFPLFLPPGGGCFFWSVSHRVSHRVSLLVSHRASPVASLRVSLRQVPWFPLFLPPGGGCFFWSVSHRVSHRVSLLVSHRASPVASLRVSLRQVPGSPVRMASR